MPNVVFASDEKILAFDPHDKVVYPCVDVVKSYLKEGSDRTGTVAIILLAYHGVNRDEIIQDSVVTTFSPVCYNQAARDKGKTQSVLDGLNSYEGETLSEKAKSYLESIGLTQRELYNIKALMFGDSLEDFVYEKDYGIRLDTNYYNTSSNADFNITLNENNAVSQVLIDGTAVSFTQNECTLSLSSASLKSFSEGAHSGEVIFSDGKITVRDAVEILKFIAGITDTSNGFEYAADINGDRSVTILDAIRILKYVARITDYL